MTNHFSPAAAPAGKRIAVIGGGISGLACAWLLAQRHEVVLYEAASRLGGHTHTVDITLDGVTHPVDTGFLVYNDRTYPLLIALFAHLGVPTAPSEMSFSVRLPADRMEWAGASLATVFVQKRNLLRPRFWRMLDDLLRFNRRATALVAAHTTTGQTLGEFLAAGNYGDAFRDWYLLPMCGAIWSCPARSMLEFPVDTLLRFCANHGLLQLTGRPQWRTVVGGGREYVWRLAAELSDVRLGTPVTCVTRRANGAAVTAAGATECFDEVVFACHSDQALAVLADASGDERAALAPIRYQPNRAVLHTDRSFLPSRPAAWSAWNYHADAAGAPGVDGRPLAVSYLINRLQPLPFSQPVIVTLNPERAPAPASMLGTFEYAHPLFDAPAIAAQTLLPAVQGVRRTWFCGAWTGYGFHEDGLRSGVAVAAALGCATPWSTAPAEQPAVASRPLPPVKHAMPAELNA